MRDDDENAVMQQDEIMKVGLQHPSQTPDKTRAPMHSASIHLPPLKRRSEERMLVLAFVSEVKDASVGGWFVQS
jgi:hypothetical protein